MPTIQELQLKIDELKAKIEDLKADKVILNNKIDELKLDKQELKQRLNHCLNKLERDHHQFCQCVLNQQLSPDILKLLKISLPEYQHWLCSPEVKDA